MGEQKPTMRTMSVAEIKDQLSSLVNAVSRRETHILVEESGFPMAAIVSYNDLVRVKQIEQSWEEGTRVFERPGAAFADLSPEEMEAEIDRIIAEGRARDLAEAERQPA